ncbi:ABC transporter ATP-binding protein [Brumimicrobium aurantiacum]|uniref:ABC transporter ATP-binding protein n=1 Tax=Brumimicrobium aurantiacum TaxID=1737063 RepID=A0A3E1F207_9FLAO|nr:ABC transporter ATP-binding protein [Brumimicrobium aurantiacum]RFC55747.1 ABC transporter ATP-binding protein [Brumimicrobium aurantiacum]
MLFLSILIGMLDGLGLTMFLPLLQMADGSSQVSSEGMGSMGFVVEGIESLGIVLNIRTALLFMFGFFTLKGIIYYASLKFNVRILQFFVSSMRIKLTDLFTRYSFQQFVSSDVGRIQNSMTGEVARVSNAYKNFADSVQNLIMVMVYLSFVFLVDWKFALLVSVGGGLSNLFFSRLFKKTKEQSAELTKNNSKFQGVIIQYIANFKYLKATGFVRTYAHRLKDQIREVEKNNTQIGILHSKITALREPILIGVVCIVILIQVEFLGGQLASIMISLLFFYRALSGLMIFQASYNNYLSVSGSLDNIVKFENELKESAELEGKREIHQFKNHIVADKVDFGYDQADGILKGLSLKIHKNKTIAFVGESGSGKTTLVNLLGGLLRPSNGEVYIDDIPFKELNMHSYQSRIGYITQEPVVFNDTIYNNVTLWAETTEENIQRYEEALNQASLIEFINTLPKEGETLLGNNGINLSGGQKQRISIARELFKDIDILILDEATSALDSETEMEIQTNIDQIKGDYTILIIAHRLSTIKNADKVYMMDKGKIVGQGNFKELVKSSDRFKRMVELQEL